MGSKVIKLFLVVFILVSHHNIYQHFIIILFIMFFITFIIKFINLYLLKVLNYLKIILI